MLALVGVEDILQGIKFPSKVVNTLLMFPPRRGLATYHYLIFGKQQRRKQQEMELISTSFFALQRGVRFAL
jgi:hypothetical protein